LSTPAKETGPVEGLFFVDVNPSQPGEGGGLVAGGGLTGCSIVVVVVPRGPLSPDHIPNATMAKMTKIAPTRKAMPLPGPMP
jgi:hypothetical protein